MDGRPIGLEDIHVGTDRGFDGPDPFATAARTASVYPATFLDTPASQASARARLARVVDAVLPLDLANDARTVAFRDRADGSEHVAVLIGTPERVAEPLVGVHPFRCVRSFALCLLTGGPRPPENIVARLSACGGGVVLFVDDRPDPIGHFREGRRQTCDFCVRRAVEGGDPRAGGCTEELAATMLLLLGMPRVRFFERRLCGPMRDPFAGGSGFFKTVGSAEETAGRGGDWQIDDERRSQMGDVATTARNPIQAAQPRASLRRHESRRLRSSTTAIYDDGPE